MKLLVINDTHLRGTTPQRRLDNLKQTLLTKLEEVNEIARREEVDFILHGGDLFDRPNPAPSVVSDFLKVLRQAPVPIYLVAGNHDLYGHNPDTLSRTMLGLLITSGVVNIVDQPLVLEENGLEVGLTGKSFDYNVDTNQSAYAAEHPGEVDYTIHLVHGMLLDRPVFPSNYTLIEDVSSAADIVISGHYHFGFGVQEFNGTKFVNPGALVRLSADLREIDRTPKVAVIDLEGEIEIEEIELDSAQPGEEVLDRSELEAAEVREKRLAEFTQTVKAAGEFKYFSVEQILEEVAVNEEVDPEVKEEALDRIGNVQEELRSERN